MDPRDQARGADGARERAHGLRRRVGGDLQPRQRLLVGADVRRETGDPAGRLEAERQLHPLAHAAEHVATSGQHALADRLGVPLGLPGGACLLALELLELAPGIADAVVHASGRALELDLGFSLGRYRHGETKSGLLAFASLVPPAWKRR